MFPLVKLEKDLHFHIQLKVKELHYETSACLYPSKTTKYDLLTDIHSAVLLREMRVVRFNRELSLWRRFRNYCQLVPSAELFKLNSRTWATGACNGGKFSCRRIDVKRIDHGTWVRTFQCLTRRIFIHEKLLFFQLK